MRSWYLNLCLRRFSCVLAFTLIMASHLEAQSEKVPEVVEQEAHQSSRVLGNATLVNDCWVSFERGSDRIVSDSAITDKDHEASPKPSAIRGSTAIWAERTVVGWGSNMRTGASLNSFTWRAVIP